MLAENKEETPQETLIITLKARDEKDQISKDNAVLVCLGDNELAPFKETHSKLEVRHYQNMQQHIIIT